MAKLPLDGVRVLEICPMNAGTSANGILGDLGAEVIRVESTQYWQYGHRGSRARPSKESVLKAGAGSWGYPGQDPGPDPWNRFGLTQALSRNKLSMTVDLRKPEGVEVFKRLIKVSDVFIESNSPPLMKRLGLEYPVLREVNPDLIMVRASAYGLSGPYSERPGMAQTMEAFTGHVSVRGYPDIAPSDFPASISADGCSGASIALATVMALHHRKRTGKGQLVEMAQVENFLPLLGYFFMDYFLNQRLHGPVGDRHLTAAPCGCYPCSGQDKWVNITVHDDAEWEGFCRALGNPEWTRDPGLVTVVGRYAKQDEMDERIAEWTKTRDRYVVMEAMQKEGVPAGPVLTSKDTFHDPQLQTRGHFEEVTAPSTGSYLVTSSPIRMSRTPRLKVRYPAPKLGEHNEYVYKELLGYSDADCARLEAEGHIGTEPAAHIP